MDEKAEKERYITWKRQKWWIFARKEKEEYPYLNLISFHHSIAISSYQLGEKAENERYTTLKGLKMKDICQNKEIKKYPYINLISFPHSIAISFYQLCEKSRNWKIHNFKRTENEGYSPEQKMKNICIRKWKIYNLKKDRKWKISTLSFAISSF